MKKLLSLILTLALMATMLVFGGVSASAAAATVSGETSYATEGYVHVTESVSAGTQTIYYNVNDTTDSETTDYLNNFSTSKKYWSLLKFNVGNYNEIESIVLKLTAKRSKYSRIRVYSLNKTDYENAIAGTVDGFKSLSTAGEDTLLTAPQEKDRIAQTSYKSSNDSDYSVFNLSLTSADIKDAVLTDGYVYLALGCSYTDSDGAVTAKTGYVKTPFDATAENHPALKIVGTKPIEGLGTKIIAQKTDTLHFTGEDEIGYVGTDTSTGEGLEGNQATGAGDYVLITNKSKNLDSRLYLRKDLSAYADKEIVKVEFKVYNRQHRSGVKTYIARTDATWIADGENEISYTNQPAVDSTVSEIQFKGSSSENATTTADITSLVENLGIAQNNVLSLRFRSNKYEDKDLKGATFYNVGKTTTTNTSAARLVITYLDELDTAAEEKIAPDTTFTFKGEISDANVPVRLIVAVYNGEELLGVVVTPDTATRELPVDLSAYSTATNVKCFFWNGTTLEPFMGITEANIATPAA